MARKKLQNTKGQKTALKTEQGLLNKAFSDRLHF
jgi:hypothetical protein